MGLMYKKAARERYRDTEIPVVDFDMRVNLPVKYLVLVHTYKLRSPNRHW